MRAQNRHDSAKWKKKGHDSRSKCGRAKCSICHPHKSLGGNHRGVVKEKYYLKYKLIVE